MPGSEFDFRADDGQTLLARRWLPEGSPRAIVQIAHGLAEHSARYARLAAALNSAGESAWATKSPARVATNSFRTLNSLRSVSDTQNRVTAVRAKIHSESIG